MEGRGKGEEAEGDLGTKSAILQDFSTGTLIEFASYSGYYV